MALAPLYGLGRYPARWLALGLLDRIWAWAAVHAPRGVLPEPTVAASELAEAIDWDRTPDELWGLLGASGVILAGGIEPGSDAPPPGEPGAYHVARWWAEVGSDLARYSERAERERERKDAWRKAQQTQQDDRRRGRDADRTRTGRGRITADQIRRDQIREEISTQAHNFNTTFVGDAPPPAAAHAPSADVRAPSDAPPAPTPNEPTPAPTAKASRAVRQRKAKPSQLTLDHEASTPAPSRLGACPIVLRNGELWAPSDDLVRRLNVSYPGVDIEADWRNLAAKYACWPKSDRKVNGERFFTNWVASTAGRLKAYAATAPKPKPQAEAAPRPAPPVYEAPEYMRTPVERRPDVGEDESLPEWMRES